MERRTITNLHELRLERDFLKKEIQLKYAEVNNEWTMIKSNLQQILLIGAAQKVIGIFKKKD